MRPVGKEIFVKECNDLGDHLDGSVGHQHVRSRPRIFFGTYYQSNAWMLEKLHASLVNANAVDMVVELVLSDCLS